jgi:asparagine synthase (glutamine-hydrolysing)
VGAGSVVAYDSSRSDTIANGIRIGGVDVGGLTGDAARERGLFRPEYVEQLMAGPNDDLTPLKGNKLWQLGLLELWLQTHGV